MRNYIRKITKEQYDRAVTNNCHITREDEKLVFNDSERLGYGIARDSVFEKNGEYFVDFSAYDSCD